MAGTTFSGVNGFARAFGPGSGALAACAKAGSVPALGAATL